MTTVVGQARDHPDQSISASHSDTVPHRDAWSEDEAELVKAVLGDPMMPDRCENACRILGQLNGSAQCVTCGSVGHEIRDEMLYDIVRFFRANMGDERIPRHWREDKPLAEDTSLLIVIENRIGGRDHRQLSKFAAAAGFEFSLHADKNPVVQLSEHNLTGTLSTGDGGVQAFLIRLDDAQLAALAPGAPCELVPTNENDDEGFRWEVDPGVTLVRPAATGNSSCDD
jgi:hypothetical protein